jgi:hypothetical protein
MSKLKQIVFEVAERVVVRSGEFTTAGDCPFCGEKVAMGTPCTAAALYGVTEREIFRLIEAGNIHFTEIAQVMICLKSIREFLEELKK